MARPRGSLSTRRRMLTLARARKTKTPLDKVDERRLTDLDVRLIRGRHKLASTLLKALKGAEAAKKQAFFEPLFPVPTYRLPSTHWTSYVIFVPHPQTVLAVSKYPYVAQMLRDVFDAAGYDVFLASNGYSALRLFCETRPPLIVSDLRMLRGDLSGIELLQEVRKRDPDVAVILLTGDRTGTEGLHCLRLGAFKVLQKPVQVYELLLAAERALERRELLVERRLMLQLLGLASS